MIVALVASACTAAALSAPPVELRFADMFVAPIGAAGLQPTRALVDLDGHRVAIGGYLVRRHAGAGSILLAPVPVSLDDEDEGLADDLPAATLRVRLPTGFDDAPIRWVAGRQRLVGTLCIGPEREPDGRFLPMSLLLDEASVRALANIRKDTR